MPSVHNLNHNYDRGEIYLEIYISMEKLSLKVDFFLQNEKLEGGSKF